MASIEKTAARLAYIQKNGLGYGPSAWKETTKMTNEASRTEPVKKAKKTKAKK
jgi:hypothetical protein